MRDLAPCWLILLLLFCGCQVASPRPGTLPAETSTAGSRRGVHLLVNTDDELTTLRTRLPALAAAGVNAVIVEVGYNFAYQSHPELAAKQGSTRAGARLLAAEARRVGIRLIPELDCVGHQSWAATTFALLTKYPEFDETPGQYPANKDIYCRSWCPQHPGVYPIIFDLIDELVEAFEADAFHVGMDEVFLIASEFCPRCQGGNPAELFAHAVKTLHGHVVGQRRLEMLMWGDRLLDADLMKGGEWEYARNGTAGAVDLIPKDIVVCDWHYEKQAAYPSVPFLLGKGFRVWPASWQPLDAAKAFSDFCREQRDPRLVGFLTTVWGKEKIEHIDRWPPVADVLRDWR